MKIVISTPAQSRTLLAIALLAMILNVYGQAPTHSPIKNGNIDENISGYWEYLPRDYAPTAIERYPLIIFFHGAGEQGTVLNKVLAAGPPKIINSGLFPEQFSVFGKTYKYIILSPQIINGIIGNTSIITPQTVSRFISFAKSSYPVDPARVYLLGLSMGGGAIWDYVGSSPVAADGIAAVAVACGAADLSPEEANSIATSNLQVLTGHNVHDNVIPVTRTRNNIDSILIASPSNRPSPQAFYWSVPLPGNSTHNVWSRMFENISASTVEGGNLTDSLGMNIYQWLLQYSRPAMVLPVKWESFTARHLGGKIELSWQVSHQQNVVDYSVERSQDGINWQIIHTIETKKNTAEPVAYRYIDVRPLNATNLYRIREKDIDGTLNYSNIQIVMIRSSFSRLIRIFPNPFSTELNLDLPSTLSGIFFFEIYNSTGKLIWQNSKKLLTAPTRITFKSPSYLMPGFYHLVLKDMHGNILHAGQVLKI